MSEDSVSQVGSNDNGAARAILDVSEVSFQSADSFERSSREEKCFVSGTRIPRFIDGVLVPMEELRVGDEIRACNGEAIRVMRVVEHAGQHDIVTVQAGDAALTMTASHRVHVMRGGRVPAPARSLRIGDDIVTSNGILPIDGLSMERRFSTVYQVVFHPNLGVECFSNAIITEGGRPPRLRGGNGDNGADVRTDDGFEL